MTEKEGKEEKEEKVDIANNLITNLTPQQNEHPAQQPPQRGRLPLIPTSIQLPMSTEYKDTDINPNTSINIEKSSTGLAECTPVIVDSHSAQEAPKQSIANQLITQTMIKKNQNKPKSKSKSKQKKKQKKSVNNNHYHHHHHHPSKKGFQSQPQLISSHSVKLQDTTNQRKKRRFIHWNSNTLQNSNSNSNNSNNSNLNRNRPNYSDQSSSLSLSSSSSLSLSLSSINRNRNANPSKTRMNAITHSQSMRSANSIREIIDIYSTPKQQEQQQQQQQQQTE